MAKFGIPELLLLSPCFDFDLDVVIGFFLAQWVVLPAARLVVGALELDLMTDVSNLGYKKFL
ncbi:MAG: hypothetical protein MJA29_05575 [Candidatus Omnitrophica bacterium]|nr:hypothetical protein [Candidatus Omnitrophota bacterium]